MARVWTKQGVEVPRVQAARQPPFGPVPLLVSNSGASPRTLLPHNSDYLFKIHGHRFFEMTGKCFFASSDNSSCHDENSCCYLWESALRLLTSLGVQHLLHTAWQDNTNSLTPHVTIEQTIGKLVQLSPV